MREYPSRSASATGSHGQGTELQNRGKSKGKRPDRRLYTPDQLSHLRASRRYQPDVAGEASDQRVLNTPQILNFPGGQLPPVTDVNLAPLSAGAIGSTLTTPPSGKLFQTRLPRPQPHQLLRAQLAGSPRPGRQQSGVGNVGSTPPDAAAAMGSTLDTHPRAQPTRVQHPPTQIPPLQLPRPQLAGSLRPGSRPSGVSNVGSTPPDAPAIGSTEKPRPRVKPTRPQRLRGLLSHRPLTHSPPSGKQPSGLRSIDPDRKANAMRVNQTAKPPRSQPPQSHLPPSLLPLPRNSDSHSHLSALSTISSTSRPKALANHQTSKLPQTHRSRTLLPLNHYSLVNSTDPSVGNIPNTRQQPKLPGSQLLASQSSGADSVGPTLKTSTTRSTVKKSRDLYNTKAEDGGIHLRPKRCYPAEVQPTSGKNVKGASPAAEGATRPLSFERDLAEYSGVHLQPKTSNRAEVHRGPRRDPETMSPRRKAPSSQIGSGNHKNLSPSSSTDSLIPKPLNIVKKNGPQRFTSNSPQIPTPPLPTPLPQTVEGDRRVPIHTHPYTLACLTGSSLAGFSRSAEGSEDDDTERSPSLERRDGQSSTRPSRTERDGQSDNLILRPEHTYTGGAGFRRRAAFTSSQANLFLNTQYQHPTPLSGDHVPPFRNSPPTPRSTGVRDTPP